MSAGRRLRADDDRGRAGPAPAGLPRRHHLQDPLPRGRGAGHAARTASGYRTFSGEDVERLRYILTAQRDRFWPLKVIRDALDALDRGLHAGAAPPEAPSRPPPRRPTRPRVPTAGDLTRASDAAADRAPSCARRPGSTSATFADADDVRPAASRPRGPLRRGRPGRRPRRRRRWRRTASSRATCGPSAPPPTARSAWSSRSTSPMRGRGSAGRAPRGRTPRRDACACASPCTQPWSGTGLAADGLDAGYGGGVKVLDVLGVRVEMPTNQPIVLLRERDGDRYLPIWIGAAEATAIAYAQQGVVPPRPLTHDLLKNVIEDLGHELTEVRIVALKDGVFHAASIFDGGGRGQRRASSDAIALALRTGTEIVAEEALLDEAGVAMARGGGRRGREVQGVPGPRLGRGLRDQRAGQRGAARDRDRRAERRPHPQLHVESRACRWRDTPTAQARSGR